MNDVCHPILCIGQRAVRLCVTILKHKTFSIGKKRSIFMIGSVAHRVREIILSRPLCEEPRYASYIQGSDREGVIATTLACGNKKPFHVKALSALILTVSEIRPESTATV